MHTTIASLLLDGTTDQVRGRLRAELKAQLGDAPPVLVCVFASTRQDLATLVGEVAFEGTVAIGASTAGEFVERGDAKGSVAVFALAGDGYRASAGIGTDLARQPEAAIANALAGQPRSIEGFPHRTALTLLDPLAGNGEEVALMLAGELGPDQPLAGGAAGDDLAMKRTYVALGGRAVSDGLVVAQIFSAQPLAVGIEHGHRPLSEPLHVTRAQGGVVLEIEGRPAWDVWRERTREAAEARGISVDAITDADAGAFLLQFQAGLSNGSGYKIRAPLSRASDGSISFAAAIPEGSVLRIMQSDSRGQVESAVAAARRARIALGDRPCAGALVFDCICRNLILGDAFGNAVRGVSRELGDVKIAGFETYGEVGLSAGEMSGFHNSTSVVLAFPR